ncbi:MAG: hypothetical protein ORO03_01885 [Alphaproteobacteria bacterium]|nr:hypothetical protein [Alphaproteobacteria bacterium]
MQKTSRSIAALVALGLVAGCSITDTMTMHRVKNQVFYKNVGGLTGQKSFVSGAATLCGSPYLVESVKTRLYEGFTLFGYPLIHPVSDYTITCKDESRMDVSGKRPMGRANLADLDSEAYE